MIKNSIVYYNTIMSVIDTWLKDLRKEDNVVAKKVLESEVEPQMREWQKEYIRIKEDNDNSELGIERASFLWNNMLIGQSLLQESAKHEESIADRLLSVMESMEELRKKFFSEKENIFKDF